MPSPCVLIVEDDPMIAFDVQASLTDGGYEVCGIAISEAEAFDLAEQFQPQFAIVDVGLSPGDGRVVARELRRRWRTGVLFATAWCNEIPELSGAGGVGCMPKPFNSQDLPRALQAVAAIMEGRRPDTLPDQMVTLATKA